MREKLKALEGQLVTVYGFNTEQRRHPDGRRFYMLKHPVVRRWDASSRIDLHPVHHPGLKLDHVWIEKSADSATVERLKRTITVGRVGYYVRSDGSHDLGIRDIARIKIMDALVERLVEVHNALMDADQQKQLVSTYSDLDEIQSFLDLHGKRTEDGQMQYVLSQVYSVPEMKRWAIDQRKRLEQVQASLLRAMTGHLPRRSPDTRSPSPGSAIFLNRQTQTHSEQAESKLDQLLRDN